MDAQTQCPECGAQLIVNLRGHRRFTCGREDVYLPQMPTVPGPCVVLDVLKPCGNVETAAAMATCPRCGRIIANVSDGEPSRIMDVTDANEEWSGIDLCVECAEYLDPTEL